MRGFTLWEPWASLMAFGYKKNETRSWRTHYRGPLVIHASKNTRHARGIGALLNAAGLTLVPDDFPSTESAFPFGKVVAVVNLIDCIPTEAAEARGLTQMERACGDYSPGRFAWLTSGLRRIENPIPWKGSQGFWKVPPELVSQL